MKAASLLSDDELKAELTQFGYSAPPITGTTRNVLQKKLEAFRSGSDTIAKPTTKAGTKAKTTTTTPKATTTPAAPASNLNVSNSSTTGRMFASDLLNDSAGARGDFLQHQSSTGSLTSSSFSSISSPIRQQQPQQPSPRSPLRMFAGSGGGSGSGTAQKPAVTASREPTPNVVYKSPPGRQNFNSSSSTSAAAASRRSFLDAFDGEEDGEDDHMESSRILSPKSRFRPSLGMGSSSASRPFVPLKASGGSYSPVEKFKNFGRSAWGFFSRPLGTSTPCSDSGYKYTGYATTPSNKYRRNYGSTSSPDYGPSDYGHKKAAVLVDSSRYVGAVIVAFLALLLGGYLYQAHTEAVYSAYGTGKDVALRTYNFVYNYAILPVFLCLILALACFGVYKVLDHFRRKRLDQKRSLIELVERITDIIFESGSAGIAEPHVRDMLMPPSKRTEEQYKLWRSAAQFINNEDSRIRTEIRLIDGMECKVWIWTGAVKQRWQGTAVAEGSPMAKVPEQALTRCLKLRGIDFSDNNVERDNLRKELLAKMKPIVPKHLGFISNNDENVVYMMLRDLRDAKRAFIAFHSHWFNGSMITVKYVRDERYLERFPDAGNF